MSMSDNPFTIIFGVEPESMIPRNEEYQKIITDFEGNRPSSLGYVITGVRGCGKTVLMTSIQHYFSEKRDWIVLRLNPDLDLYESSISQLSEYIHLKEEIATDINISIAGFGGGLAKRSLSDNETILKKMLVLANKKHKRILITIDEASNTSNIKTFAHSYQAFIGEGLPVFLLMTALPENFSALANSKNGTFMRRLPRVKLDSLNPILIEEKYKQIFSLNSVEAIKLSKIVQGYPYAFQLLGTLLWNAKKKQVDEDIITSLDTMLYDGAYKAIWDHLSAKEKRVMSAIAHSEDHSVSGIREKLGMESNQFSPYRENLKEYGLIDTASYGKIDFKLPRFTEFIIRMEQYY